MGWRVAGGKKGPMEWGGGEEESGACRGMDAGGSARRGRAAAEERSNGKAVEAAQSFALSPNATPGLRLPAARLPPRRRGLIPSLRARRVAVVPAVTEVVSFGEELEKELLGDAEGGTLTEVGVDAGE